jgi:ubiquitin-conjugating enzyme E2 D/E
MLNQKKLSAMKNLKEQYKDLRNNPIANIGLSVGLIDEDDIFNWRCSIVAPQDTPYSDGLFFLLVKFTEDFPQKGPEICFETPIYHVNVNSREKEGEDGSALGKICINTLSQWNPNTKVRQVLDSIYTLFYLGNPDNPFGIDKANEFKNHKDLYEEKIRYFTQKYANISHMNREKNSKAWDFTYNK